MCARRSGNILFYFVADNFTGSKDTEPYKTDVSFFYFFVSNQAKLKNDVMQNHFCQNAVSFKVLYSGFI